MAAGIAGCSSKDKGDKPLPDDNPATGTVPDDTQGGGTTPDNGTTPPDNSSGGDESQDFISVAVTTQQLTIKDYEVKDYNFARYFRISDNNKGISAGNYVDASAVKAEEGVYTVVCTYKGESATITVNVVASKSTITLSKSSVKLNTAEVASYNFKELFTLVVDGSKRAITDDMVTTDLKDEPGEYTYTVTFFGNSETLYITVLDEYAIEIVKSYSVLELTKEELDGFDYTSLFSLYIGGIAERVSIDEIDSSALNGAVEGERYPVTISVERNGREASSTVYIDVVAEAQISITAKEIVTYPNGDDIDLKTLFTIKRGNVYIEVTDDMITGTIDYSKEGDNEITLEYGGRTAVAIVSIKLGVILGYASSDTVLIEKGTDIRTYDFGGDFSVIINGIRFTNLPLSYFDVSGVDFNTEGEYTVKLTVPYNTKKPGIKEVYFDYFEKEITYVVVSKKIEYSLKTLETTVVLPAGTTNYNVYNNLSVTINGIRRMIVENADYVDITTCYAQTVSAPIDFNSPAEQEVLIDVYVYGPDMDPVRVAYTLRIDNGVTVKGIEKVIFSGTTIFARDLFVITENGKEVTVTNDMVSGKIDLFNPGIYFVTATYKGVTAQTKAVVLDSSMMGTYKTLLTTIEQADDDDDYDYEYGWGDDYEYYTLSPDSTATFAASPLKDFVVDEYGEMYLGSKHLEILSIVDDSTFIIDYGTYEYVMKYENGIITLDPENRWKLGYHEQMRPMVYFNENVWSVETGIELNSSASGNIFQSTYSGVTTINLFHIKSVESGEYSWYGMKAQLIAKYNSDTYYAEEVFGFASMHPDFVQASGKSSTVSLGGESYNFTMSSSTKAVINKDAATVSPFAGSTFRGTVDGKEAILSVAFNDKLTFTVDNKKVFELTVSEQNQLKNAGIDYKENTWLVYNMLLDSENKPYSYRFRLDKENGTFTIDERDDLFGRYVYGKVAFFFDGYGSGEANFNTDSKYQTTGFTYKRNGANIELTFRNAQPDFEYGTTVKLLLADYKNILTVREISGIDLVGKQLVNQIITDGAIVEIKTFVVGMGNSAEDELLSGITITTKDGTLTKEQMTRNIAGTSTPYVDTSKISSVRSGFYQLTINIPMDGEIKTAYYAIQVLDVVYSENKLLGRYNRTAVSSGAMLNLDEYGRISGAYGGVSFSGSAKLTDNGFTATAECATGSMTITGELLADGILKVVARGALMFTDCFTTGTVKTSGTEGYILRAITANGVTVFMLSNASTSIGNVVEVEGDIDVLGSILKIDDGKKEYFVKITSWGGVSSGLVMSDSVRGVYKLDGADDLVLDGFGVATLGARQGTYVTYGTGITVIFGTEVKAYRINAAQGTYTVSDKALDESLIAGKSYTAKTFFSCGDSGYSSYIATTIFEFKAGGKVTVKSSSDDHDEDCNDTYSPEFATESGIEGTFTVAGNKITVTVNGKVIVFTFTDAFGLNTIKCSSTNVSSSSHGYFGPNTVFTLA